MVYVKLIRNTYGGPNYLKNACGYIQSHDLCAVGGYGVNPYDPDLAYTQMSYIKIYYGKESGNPMIHIMISLDDCAKTKEKACEFADKFARYYMDWYQVIWAVHGKERGSSNLHIHMILKSVSYVNGKMFHGDVGEMKKYCNFVAKATQRKTFLEFENKNKQSSRSG